MNHRTDNALPHWVAEAATLPVAFAQVREDSLLDLSLLDRIGGNDLRVMMIASGGCTAAALAASNRVGQLYLVDANPAQMALCRLKLHLLQHTSPLEREKVLGHQQMSSKARAKRLSQLLETLELPDNSLGPVSDVAESGPDHAGRYERVFERLRSEMWKEVDQWTALLHVEDARARSAAIEPSTPMGQAMDSAFDCVMALKNLVRLFAAQATQNSREPFSRHFAGRTRQAIATLPTRDNPYLWQLLLGRFPSVSYPWLNMAAPARMPKITEFVGPMDDALGAAETEIDYLQLSNILDWLTPDQARRTLELAAGKLRLGGYVLIRQLNSTLNIPSMSDAFEWLTEESDAMHARDRSFFYRQLHLGRKR